MCWICVCCEVFIVFDIFLRFIDFFNVILRVLGECELGSVWFLVEGFEFVGRV